MCASFGPHNAQAQTVGVARPMRYFDLAAKVVGPPGRGRQARLLRFAVSHCLLQPASSRLQRFLYAARHGVNRGIQRGTLVRKLSYSAPNVCSSVGSSNITTKT